MEWWNASPPQADQKDIRHFNFIVNPVGGGTINPTLHYPLRGVGSTLWPGSGAEARTHYSTIPGFHHSNCERSELSYLINHSTSKLINGV